MKYKYIIGVNLLIITVFLTSCSIAMINKNTKNLKLLRKGMSKIEVLAVMGDPLKDEAYHQEDVWFYFTDPKWSDGSMTRDECTPLFFEDDALAGWGHKEYKKFRLREW